MGWLVLVGKRAVALVVDSCHTFCGNILSLARKFQYPAAGVYEKREIADKEVQFHFSGNYWEAS